MTLTDNEKVNRPDNEDAIRGIDSDEQKSDYANFCKFVEGIHGWLGLAKQELIEGNVEGTINSINVLIPQIEKFLEDNKDEIIEV